MIQSASKTAVLERIGQGIEFDPDRKKLILVGRNSFNMRPHKDTRLSDRLVSLELSRQFQAQREET